MQCEVMKRNNKLHCEKWTFFFVPHFCHVDQFALNISLPSLQNSPSLLAYHTHDDFDSADPSSIGMQDSCHMWTQLDDLALHKVL